LPVLFNIIPGLLILINNSALWFYMRNYTRSLKRNDQDNYARTVTAASSTAAAAAAMMVVYNHNGTTNMTATTSLNNTTIKQQQQQRHRRYDTMTKSQRSHYFTIITLGVWMLLTSIPYYIFTTWNWAASLRVIQHSDTRSTRIYMSVQAITSAFFNSNHCVNILIYMAFYKVSIQTYLLFHLFCLLLTNT
jgi:hypothetical protein